MTTALVISRIGSEALELKFLKSYMSLIDKYIRNANLIYTINAYYVKKY